VNELVSARMTGGGSLSCDVGRRAWPVLYGAGWLPGKVTAVADANVEAPRAFMVQLHRLELWMGSKKTTAVLAPYRQIVQLPSSPPQKTLT